MRKAAHRTRGRSQRQMREGQLDRQTGDCCRKCFVFSLTVSDKKVGFSGSL